MRVASFWARGYKIVEGVDRIAHSHHLFADHIEKDVANPLRVFQQRKDYQNMNTISNNLSTMAKDLDEAKKQLDKLSKKGGKSIGQKLDAASAKLDSSTQQWESQAPFIFETLQALDESRVNHLRDVLTQYQTHEADEAQRHQQIAAETLAATLEISTEKEIQDFAQKTTAGRPNPPTRTSTRRSSIVPTQSSFGPPPRSSSGVSNSQTPATSQPPLPTAEHEDGEQNLGSFEAKPESKLRRLGTVLGGRRRQSVQAGFGQLSPQKTAGTAFGRLGSSHGRGISPRTSSSNLHESRLSALPENPDVPQPTLEKRDSTQEDTLHPNGPNGAVAGGSLLDAQSPSDAATGGVNGTAASELSDVAAPPGPPPSQQHRDANQPGKDADGFNVRAPMNDPISEAQREAAADDADQPFKLSIQNKPVEDEDPEAKLAAMSSVANSLKMGPATRRAGTVRGRRDVRNTIYVPAPTAPVNFSESISEGAMPAIQQSPPLPSSQSRPAALAALASETSVAGTSDTQSVRSGNSLGNLVLAKHPELTAPGLNCSIIETVSAVFEEDTVKSASIAGEIAFVNNASDSGDSKNHEAIRINNFANLERIGPNRIFVQNSSPDQFDQYSLDLSHLAKTSIAFSYRVFADDSEAPALAQHAPLLLKPAWKPQGDKLGLLLQYQLNPSSKFTAPVTLHNVVFVARYEGKASGAQTKPTGTHLKEKHLVYWRLGDVTLTNEVQKIVCRIVGADGATPAPGHIEARWEYTSSDNDVLGSGISISRLGDSKGKGKEVANDDPFADESPSG